MAAAGLLLVALPPSLSALIAALPRSWARHWHPSLDESLALGKQSGSKWCAKNGASVGVGLGARVEMRGVGEFHDMITMEFLTGPKCKRKISRWGAASGSTFHSDVRFRYQDKRTLKDSCHFLTHQLRFFKRIW